MSASLIELAREVVPRLDAPASFVASQIVSLDGDGDGADVDEWIALDVGVARRMAEGGSPVVLRVPASPDAFQLVPPHPNLSLEMVVSGADEPARSLAAATVQKALDEGLPLRAVLASGQTGIDAYRACATARQVLGTRVPIRVRWDDVLDVKGAALALTFGADELAGPLAPEPVRRMLAQIGGPPEDVNHPSPAYVESLIRAAGRLPSRRRK
jgi:hypothetical protein